MFEKKQSKPERFFLLQPATAVPVRGKNQRHWAEDNNNICIAISFYFSCHPTQISRLGTKFYGSDLFDYKYFKNFIKNIANQEFN